MLPGVMCDVGKTMRTCSGVRKGGAGGGGGGTYGLS